MAQRRANGAGSGGTVDRGPIAAALQRLLFVALFVLGFGEAPFGGGDSASARDSLRAERALALSPCDTHPGDPALMSAVERELPARGLNGGESELFPAAAPAARAGPQRGGEQELQAAVASGTTRHGFKPRAPPASS